MNATRAQALDTVATCPGVILALTLAFAAAWWTESLPREGLAALLLAVVLLQALLTHRARVLAAR